VTPQIIGQTDAPTDANALPDGATPANEQAHSTPKPVPVEIGGRKGPDPVRYGDWEKNGRCIDF